MISEQLIEEVLDSTDLVELISRTVQLKKKGIRYEGLCPFHKEKTPSFQVNPQMGFFYCQGCHVGGNAITFLMKDQNLGFREAVLQLAREHNISVPNEKEPTDAERKQQLHREALITINTKVTEFYQNKFSTPKALSYIEKRWKKEFAESIGMGYADNTWDSLYKFAQEEGLSIDLMLELGLLKKNEDKNRIYDFYRDRVMIPIYDRFSRVIGFTGRDISGNDGVPKYFNSSNSEIYNKDNSLFGINFALREIVRKDKAYCVEGAPDVIRMHYIKVANTVASLGSAWTENQFYQLKKLTSNICFIPDADPKKDSDFPVGVKAVMENGKRAIKMGFNVTVRELPDGEGGKKNDPDSYCTSFQKFDELEENDFITWYATKLFAGKENTEEIHKVVTEICNLIVMINDEMKEEMYLLAVKKSYNDKSLWTKAIKFARQQRKAKQILAKGKTIDRDLYQKYGFYENYGGYFAMSNNNGETQWSNFIMEPMFHIRDTVNPKRMYRIINQNKQEEIIEMKQEDLVSLSKFRQRIEGMGNFIFEASEKELIKLKKFLYEQTETATEIVQLGWQRQGFYAWGNGIYDGIWHPVDEFGIVRLNNNANYYLPANSKIYAQDDKLFQFERKFIHLNYNSISLKEVAGKIVHVFGDNGKIGICFLLATLFRDIIVNYTKNFPILNLFGPKGAGKSELGHTLMSFFINRNTPPNISNATIAAMADAVAQCANAIVHLDEFKNSIDLDKREFLKGLWDGAGRSRMNMDRDKKREITSVDCGVIVSGQEMATADIALFSRFVFLRFNKTEYSSDEKARFMDLNRIQGMGFTHLTLQILSHRAKMQQGFVTNYKQCGDDLIEYLKEAVIEDRILRNWQTLLAAFKTLEAYIDLPFSYKELLPIFTEGIILQNKECKANNELSNFWNVVAYLQQEGEIFIDGDYRIDYVRELKTNIASIKYLDEKPILKLRRSRIFMLYKKFGRMVGDTVLPEGSLKYYLENSKEYLGTMNSVRFKDIKKGGIEVTKAVDTGTGKEFKKTSGVDMAFCFDYQKIMDNYGIDINVYTDEFEDSL